MFYETDNDWNQNLIGSDCMTQSATTIVFRRRLFTATFWLKNLRVFVLNLRQLSANFLRPKIPIRSHDTNKQRRRY